MYPHRVIAGRIYRVLTVEAGDTAASSRHISAERPIPTAEQRTVREEAAQ